MPFQTPSRLYAVYRGLDMFVHVKMSVNWRAGSIGIVCPRVIVVIYIQNLLHTIIGTPWRSKGLVGRRGMLRSLLGHINVAIHLGRIHTCID